MTTATKRTNLHTCVSQLANELAYKHLALPDSNLNNIPIHVNAKKLKPIESLPIICTSRIHIMTFLSYQNIRNKNSLHFSTRKNICEERTWSIKGITVIDN